MDFKIKANIIIEAKNIDEVFLKIGKYYLELYKYSIGKRNKDVNNIFKPNSEIHIIPLHSIVNIPPKEKPA